jgi:para-aminobenzoate synthetase component I
MSGEPLPLYSRRLGAWIDPADVFVTLYAGDQNSFWLDRQRHPTERYSVMGHANAHRVVATEAMFGELESRLGEHLNPQPPFSWRPGFVGWFEYQQDPLDPSELRGSWIDAREALVFDHDERAVWAIGEFRDDEHFEEWLKGGFIRLGLSGGRRIGYLGNHRLTVASELIGLAHSPSEYLKLVERARAHIAAGDVYQICLTNRIDASHQADPLEVFLRLREANPAPYACYIKQGERALVSVSPEQFLTVSSSGALSTRPIKGTRPRSENPVQDAATASELETNEKERAENLMIVDLMRNDLARVAEPASVEVTELFSVEPHPTVHQLVSTVTGQLRAGVTASGLVHAMFPGGSMTGAPKIRAMQLIAELEQTTRGIYSGVAGYFGTDGSADLGMVIRSLVFEGERVSIGVGGGITIDSDPAAELAETRLKAKSLLAAIALEDPWA